MPETDDSQLAKARLAYPAMGAVDNENKYRPPRDLKFEAFGRRVTEAEHNARCNLFNFLRKYGCDPTEISKW